MARLDTPRPRVVFLLPYAEAVISRESQELAYTARVAGGAELQAAFIAQIIKDECSVSFLSVYESPMEKNRVKRIDGIDFLKVIKLKRRTPWEKLYYYWILPFFVLLRRSPDLVYMRANSIYYPPLLLYMAVTGAKCIFHFSSDEQFTPSGGDGILQRQILKRAHRIVSQTEYQRTIVKSLYSLDSIILKNYFPPPVEDPVVKSESILWVSNLSDNKQPHHFLQLARRNPALRCIMVGPPALYATEYTKRMREEVHTIGNLQYHDFVSFYDCMELYRQAKVFVNTSRLEGFPNSFLQAWASGAAIVSLNVDPDGILGKFGIGICCNGDEEKMHQTILRLLKDEHERETLARNGLEYLMTNHASPELRREITNLFLS